MRTPITGRRVGIYTVDQLADRFLELVTQTGLSVKDAAICSGYKNELSIYVPLGRKTGVSSGLKMMLRVLRSIGYKVVVQVTVTRTDMHTERRDYLDPRFRMNTRYIMRVRRRKAQKLLTRKVNW